MVEILFARQHPIEATHAHQGVMDALLDHLSVERDTPPLFFLPALEQCVLRSPNKCLAALMQKDRFPEEPFIKHGRTFPSSAGRQIHTGSYCMIVVIEVFSHGSIVCSV